MADNIFNPTDVLDFGIPEEKHSIIKVIGVGGGGGNAVNHMYNEGIHDVTFVVCNTDNQALNDSPVPMKIQLGSEGLGAGNRPAKAREAAEESIEDIRRMLSDGTRMAFITAGMGGGTGTGAAPVIARVSKEMGILTVGIVTIPFRFEGNKKIDQALDGVEEMSKHVDALLVINNERLRAIYGNLSFRQAFGKADDTLSIAARSIAEIITVHGIINLDFNDVQVYLIEATPRVLPMMTEDLQQETVRVLQKKGVNVMLNTQVVGYDGDVLKLKSGAEIPTTTVIWAAGVRAVDMMKNCGGECARDGRIWVEEDLMVRGAVHKNVFAIGDCAAFMHGDMQRPLPTVAPVATQQAVTAHKNIMKLIKGEGGLEKFEIGRAHV